MNYELFSKLCLVVSVALMVISLFKKRESTSHILEKHYFKIICVLFSIALFSTLFNFGDLPYGINVDEAGMAYDAWSIANYGVDRYMYEFPVYFINYGGGQNALYGYLAAIFIKIFGLSIYTIRMPAVLFRVIVFISIYLLTRNRNKINSIFILLLYSITPFFIMYSRWGLESYLMIGMITLSVTMTMKALNTREMKYYILSAVCFGISLYTYAISYITIPLILCGILLYAVINRKINFKEFTAVVGIIFVIALPLLLVLLINNGVIEEIKSFISMPEFLVYRGPEISFSNVFKNLDIFQILFTHDNMHIYADGAFYNAVPEYYTLYLMTIPFVFFGMFISLCNVIKNKLKDTDLDYIMIVWFLASLISMLLIAAPNINKANAIFIPLIYFASVGIGYIANKMRQAAYLIIILLLLNYGSFFHFYLTGYTKLTELSFVFATTYLEALEFAVDLDKEVIYSDSLTAEAYIYPHLIYKIPPDKFNKEEVYVKEIDMTFKYILPEEIDYDAVYLKHVTWAESLEEFLPEGITHHYEVFLDKSVVWFEEE